MSHYSLQAVVQQIGTELSLNPRQAEVLQHIRLCQTEALSGYRLDCADCHHETIRYHSCRDRHCPRCQAHAQQRWSERQQSLALPVPYYHLVFTLPHELNGWVSLHPRTVYRLLFQCVWHCLRQFGRDAKRLGGELGMTAVLHTWGQKLERHVHLHCLIPGGALTAEGTWNAAKSNYLFPVKALSRVFRGKMVTALRHAVTDGALHRLSKAQMTVTLQQLMQKSWGVYSKPCFSRTDTVVRYLARYSHRIGLSDHRLSLRDDGQLQLRYKDYRDNNKIKWLKLSAEELLRRYCLHILPKGFMRIRHYGWLSNCSRAKKREQILQALGSDKEPEQKQKDSDKSVIYYCPKCRSTHVIVSALERLEGG